MYEIMVLIVLGISAILLAIHIVRRYIACAMAYAENKELDEFDVSTIIECGYSNGTHPAGITVDAIIYGIIAVLISMSWPASLPVVALFAWAHHHRQGFLIMEKLRDDQ